MNAIIIDLTYSQVKYRLMMIMGQWMPIQFAAKNIVGWFMRIKQVTKHKSEGYNLNWLKC